MGFSDWHHFDVRQVRRETETAFEVVTTSNKIYWLPKRSVADSGDYKAGDGNCQMSVLERVAIQKGMIDAEG